MPERNARVLFISVVICLLINGCAAWQGQIPFFATIRIMETGNKVTQQRVPIEKTVDREFDVNLTKQSALQFDFQPIWDHTQPLSLGVSQPHDDLSNTPLMPWMQWQYRW